MTRVIMNARHLFNHSRDSSERPEVGSKAVGAGSFEQGLLHTPELRRIQTTVPSGASCTSQGLGSPVLPRLEPSAHTLPADLQLSCDLGLSFPGAKELGCLLSAVLKLVEVPSCSCCRVHGDILRERNADVNILCEESVTILCEIQ
jgi:hypothetical protein